MMTSAGSTVLVSVVERVGLFLAAHAQQQLIQRENEQHLPQIDPGEIRQPFIAVQQRKQGVAQHTRFKARGQEGQEAVLHAQRLA